MDILKDQEETTFSLNISKVLFLISTFCLALLFGYLPLMTKIKKRVIRYLSFINAFSGGVFLGVGLFILLPESKEIATVYFEDLEKKEGESLLYDLPYSFFFTFLSYSCLLLLEKVCFNTSMIIPLDLNEEQGRASHIEPMQNLDEDEEEEIIRNVVSTKGKFASFLQIRNIRTSNVNDANQPVDKNLLRSSVILSKTFKYKNDDLEEANPDMDFFVNPEKVDGNNKVANKDHGHSHDHDHAHDHDDHHGHSHGKKEFSSLTPYLLLFALCLDGFFEGLAIGSQSSFTKLVFTGICLLINKCIVACNLGISFKIAVPDIRNFIRLVLLFALFTPFGIMLAFILYTYNPLIKAAFLALASGSFIYVSSSVIIIEEFTVTKYKYTKFLLFLLGGIGTALVIYFTDNN